LAGRAARGFLGRAAAIVAEGAAMGGCRAEGAREEADSAANRSMEREKCVAHSNLTQISTPWRG